MTKKQICRRSTRRKPPGPHAACRLCRRRQGARCLRPRKRCQGGLRSGRRDGGLRQERKTSTLIVGSDQGQVPSGDAMWRTAPRPWKKTGEPSQEYRTQRKTGLRPDPDARTSASARRRASVAGPAKRKDAVPDLWQKQLDRLVVSLPRLQKATVPRSMR